MDGRQNRGREGAAFAGKPARTTIVATVLIVAVIALGGGVGQSQGQSDALVVLPSGYVGVGTATPRERLDVAGSVNATGVVKARSFEGNGAVPKGAILMWSGAPDALPPGWKLCDGEDGRPDLRGRFVLGAGQNKDRKLTNRTKGDAGGDETRTLTVAEMPAHDHGGATAKDGAHTHKHKAWFQDVRGGKAGSDRQLPIKKTGQEPEWELMSNAESEHQHAIKSQGGGQPFPLMPPYYVLAYIIRVE